jgi:hypothetical protein
MFTNVPPIGQLLVEFHYGRPEWKIQLTDVRQAVSSIEGAGFRLFDISTTGREYAFVSSILLDGKEHRASGVTG